MAAPAGAERLLAGTCRKSNEDGVKERRRASGLLSMAEPSLLQFYISRQWLNKFKTFAEPGPISNNDFLCSHGGEAWAVLIGWKVIHLGYLSAEDAAGSMSTFDLL